MHISFTKSVALIVAFLALLLHTAAAQEVRRASVKGRVIDSSTRAPIQDANVFLANTMIGDATDREGRFSIEKIPPGTYELIISFIGYEVKKIPLRIDHPQQREFTIRLKQKFIEVPEIAVTADKIKDWQSNWRRFKKLFLGTSENAQACEIANAYVLDFIPEKGSRPFTAIATAPLEIVNPALGYKLLFILEFFEARNKEVRYVGKARFTEMAPQSRQQKVQWRQNRVQTYRGSLRHFLASLYDNTLKKEGFLAYLLPVFPRGDEEVNRTPIRPRRVLAAGKTSFEKKLHFENFIEVVYTREMEEAEYIDYRMSADPTLINADPETYDRIATPGNQRSIISLAQYDVVIDSSGLAANPQAIKLYGYWSWERVGDMLPQDYEAPFYSAEQLLADTKRDFYQEGREKLRQGAWQEALAIWENGRDALEIRGVADPRLGIGYIELATEKEAAGKYELATDIYYWGLSGSSVKKYKKSLEKELKMIRPLLPDGEYKEWEQVLKKNKKALYTKMKAFWLALDPTPTTRLNERLIEHWQRIAHARRTFKKSVSTVYGTDDRGLVYVKYGQPDRTRTVTLGTNMAEYNRWSRFDYSQASAVATTRTAQDQRDMSGEGQAPEPTRNVEIRGFDSIGAQNQVREEFNQHNYNPECELWAYNSLDSERDIVFIFGPEDGHGAFGLRNGIEELIPDRAFRRTRVKDLKDGFTGGLLQLMYYNDIAAFDEQFARRYDLLEDAWIRARKDRKLSPDGDVIRLHRTNFLAADRFNPPFKYVAPEQSGYRHSFSPIRLFSSRARFLDAQNRPKLVFVAFAFPEGLSTFRTDEMLTTEVTFSHDLKYHLIIRNSDLDEIKRLSAKPLAKLDNTGVFRLPHEASYTHFTLAVQAFPSSAAEATAAQALPGIGKEQFFIGPPLETNPASLELSDLVIGVAPPAGVDETLLPYPIIPASRVWKVDALQVYFEVYHLKLPDSGEAKFSLEFKVFRLEKKGEKLKRREMISSTFAYTSGKPTARETFGISIANLNTGQYALEVEVRDQNSGKKQVRDATFTVMER